MKEILIDFFGVKDKSNKLNNPITKILKERFNVIIADTNTPPPDFLIINPYIATVDNKNKPFEYLNNDCVRIMITYEPLLPDFNLFDYAIGFDYLICKDTYGKNRFFRMPYCFYNSYRYYENNDALNGLSYQKAKEVLQNKKDFCNFIYSHESAFGQRENLLKAINNYKKVDCAGYYLNNMPDNKIVKYSTPIPQEKLNFLSTYKFTISGETISYPGFCTEKLVEPFVVNSIPIYFGNPFVKTEFNEKSFINCLDYNNFNDVARKIKEIDNNDEAYIEMLMQPKLVSPDYYKNLYNEFKMFLWNIFEQDKQSAYRRPRAYFSLAHEQYILQYKKGYESFHKLTAKKSIRLLRAVRHPIRTLKKLF